MGMPTSCNPVSGLIPARFGVPILFPDREEMMVKISVLYPHKGGSAFNMNYYLNNHIPMVRQKLGAACKGDSSRARHRWWRPRIPANICRDGTPAV